MIKVSAGHYRDMFCRKVYDVRRVPCPWGYRGQAAWEYTIYRPDGDINNGTWDTKDKAAQAARLTIYDLN